MNTTGDKVVQAGKLSELGETGDEEVKMQSLGHEVVVQLGIDSAEGRNIIQSG